MSKRINNFELETYSKTKFKANTCLKLIPYFQDNVTLIFNDLTTINEELKTLTTSFLNSSDFADKCNNVVSLSDNVATALKDTMNALLTDTLDRIKLIAKNDAAYASELADLEAAIAGTLGVFEGLNLGASTIPKDMEPSASPEPAAETPATTEETTPETEGTPEEAANTEETTNTEETANTEETVPATEEKPEYRNLLEDPNPESSDVSLDPSTNLLDPSRNGDLSSNGELPTEVAERMAEYMANDPYYKAYAEELMAQGLMDANGNLAEGFYPLIQQGDFSGISVPGGPEIGKAGCSLTSFCIAASEQMGSLFMPNMAVDILKQSGFSGNGPAAAEYLMTNLGLDGGRNTAGNRSLVQQKLDDGYSCVIRVNDGGHYSTVTKNAQGQYVMKDSAYDVWSSTMRNNLSKPFDNLDDLLSAVKYKAGDTFYLKA